MNQRIGHLLLIRIIAILKKDLLLKRIRIHKVDEDWSLSMTRSLISASRAQVTTDLSPDNQKCN